MQQIIGAASSARLQVAGCGRALGVEWHARGAKLNISRASWPQSVTGALWAHLAVKGECELERERERVSERESDEKEETLDERPAWGDIWAPLERRWARSTSGLSSLD